MDEHRTDVSTRQRLGSATPHSAKPIRNVCSARHPVKRQNCLAEKRAVALVILIAGLHQRVERHAQSLYHRNHWPGRLLSL